MNIENYKDKTEIVKNPAYLIIAIIILLVLLLAGIRLFSGEDNWMCQNGQWIEHGHPAAPMPPAEKCHQ